MDDAGRLSAEPDLASQHQKGARAVTANYWDYIKVEQLLALQGGLDDDESAVSNDEALFISVHQVHELWFKLVLRELTLTRDMLNAPDVAGHQVVAGVRSLRRAITVFEQANQHFRLMETMTARDFLEFRERLTPASGFQSAQLREIEILLGLEDAQRISIGAGSYRDALKLPDGSPSTAAQRVEARAKAGPSLKQSLYAWLTRLPIDGATTPTAKERFARRYIQAMRADSERRWRLAAERGSSIEELQRLRARHAAEDESAQAFLLADEHAQLDAPAHDAHRAVRAALVFVESHRELPQLAWPRELLESVVELEQAMLIWRQRHARMVERFIGRRVGTGGSAGVDYLDQTALRYRIFAELWTARSLLLRTASVPVLDNPDGYGFAMEGGR
ncbi:tryptophan 2,3-dioxygenase family protein [Xanthomonas sp. WHRI 8932A]|uniref:tryptophan 2,3-dioxygenase family protein n=1 Tax=unclassified Xanthomonas TaxID=2643310 RepID=UPI002B228820|nr:tryptophan 2,3-dioxygenase family protein [Xanthomonas sp. WHRI 8932A]MEA9563076.1 tryptophan 2,3-dioxygenase family protein [Xanthomonas sp. WHRI 8932A]MEA9634129.1 tryptophan 2,3-dioxygenase family protein [Xanthomonas sp. WHRI 8812E]